MRTPSFHLAKRKKKCVLKSGAVQFRERWFLDYRCPARAKRTIKSFRTRQAALEFRDALLADVQAGTHYDRHAVPTVSEACDHYLADLNGKIKASTLRTYRIVVARIRGPLVVGTALERAFHSKTGVAPEGTKLVPILGARKINELTTAEIRAWHNLLAENCGSYTARRALTHLRAILALAEEDFKVRAPAMPRSVGRVRHRPKKTILKPDEVSRLLEAAKSDKQFGPYVAFGFVAGTRPSEQLGLLWEDVDFENNVIHIRRMQERDGTLCALTKTAAGARVVPMCAMLRAMLLEWRVSCPRVDGELNRVFPVLGQRQAWPNPRKGGGGPLSYHRFLRRFWRPFFKKRGIPYVTPHAARHGFVSTLQMQGVEVGLVAKLVGHSNAAVTLSVYTQALRGGENAVAALERAYSGG